MFGVLINLLWSEMGEEIAVYLHYYFGLDEKKKVMDFILKIYLPCKLPLFLLYCFHFHVLPLLLKTIKTSAVAGRKKWVSAHSLSSLVSKQVCTKFLQAQSGMSVQCSSSIYCLCNPILPAMPFCAWKLLRKSILPISYCTQCIY